MYRMSYPREKLVVVSNRLPITVSLVGKSITYTESAGGLVNGLKTSLEENDVWIGWPGIAKELLTPYQMEEISSYLISKNMYPVFLGQKDIDNYYNGFCNSVLWPELHSSASFINNQEEIGKYLHSYKRVNKLFAEIINRRTNDSDVIWIHDYHLLLVPHELKKWNKRCGLFLHTPFPEKFSSFYINDIVAKLKSVKLLGFQTACDEMNYKRLLKQIDVKTGVYPIGIDVNRIAPIVNNHTINRRCQSGIAILCVDRLDPVKHIADRIRAFALLISESPELRNQISLRIVAVPTRIDNETYRTEKNNLEALINETNNSLGSDEWIPIDYTYKSYSPNMLADIYSDADIALICPPHDGMNLVAKEFVAINIGKPKSLILSSGVGASHQLTDAFIVNDYSIAAITTQIKNAILTTDEELINRMDKMALCVINNDSKGWKNKFLNDLTS